MMMPGHRVGQEPARAIAGRDPNFALVGRDEQQHAVVAFGGADLPRAAQPIGVILDRIALRLLTVATTNCRPVCASSASDLLVMSTTCAGRQEMRLVDHAPREAGNVCAAAGAASATSASHKTAKKSASPQPAVLKLTVGASCAAAAAANGTLGLAP